MLQYYMFQKKLQSTYCLPLPPVENTTVKKFGNRRKQNSLRLKFDLILRWQIQDIGDGILVGVYFIEPKDKIFIGNVFFSNS
jgi:hypothetical protein